MAEVKAWITVNGQHIPIMDGESKIQAVGRFIKGRKEQKLKNKVDLANKRTTIKDSSHKAVSVANWLRYDSADTAAHKFFDENMTKVNKLISSKKVSDQNRGQAQYRQLSEDARRIQRLGPKSPLKMYLKEDKLIRVPKTAMASSSAKNRRASLQKYFYDQAKGIKINIRGTTYTKIDNAPGGLWKDSKGHSHFSEDLLKEYAHDREYKK